MIVKEVTRETCKGCKFLSWMHTMKGDKDCCKWFYPPVALENIECEHTQYGYGILVEPRLKKGKYDTKRNASL